MIKVLVITNFELNKENDGKPTGLITFITEYLERDSELHVFNSKDECIKSKLGLNHRKLSLNYTDYDLILAYPNYTAFQIPKLYLKKTIVLGPDSTSLLWIRRALSSLKNLRIKTSLISFGVFLLWTINEVIILNNVLRYVVVGEKDLKWLKNLEREKKSLYLIHPVVHPIESLSKKYKSKNAIIIYGYYTQGMWDKRFTKIAKQLSESLNKRLIVIGKSNEFISDSLITLGCNVEYKSWVENLSDYLADESNICFIPQAYGAGTKNRVLTALTGKVLVVGNRISNENIASNKLLNIEIHDIDDIKELINQIKNLTFDSTKRNSLFEQQLKLIFNV